MITLDSKTAVHSIWFIEGKGTDWLGIVSKRDGGTWTLLYRFRYHVDTKVFDSEDVKNWYEVDTRDRSDAPPPRLIEAAKHIVSMTSSHLGGRVHELRVNGDGDKAAEMLYGQSWCFLAPTAPAGDA